MKRLYSILCSTFLVAACYSPEPFVAESDDEPSDKTSEMGTLYPVNSQKQICNPSVTLDTVNFPASMLWLNFGGVLNVTAKDPAYTTKRVIQHDRLTISDNKGNVRWFVMRDVDAGECQFQDPEWSTHANFIVALRGYDINGKTSCENLDYGIFATRLSDSKRFWFFEKEIGEFATPHLWVGEPQSLSDDASSDSASGDSTVEGFFGTDEVRLTYVTDDNKIAFFDYADGGKKKTLKKPSNRSSWEIDSPLISPDGKFVVYNMLENPSTWEAYVQELSTSSNAMKIERVDGMMSEPAQPHWYSDGSDLFVVWAEFPAGSQMLNKNDLTVESVQEGSVGRTVMREVSLKTGDTKLKWNGEVRELAPVPMTGGLSPDGKYLATGTNLAYILELP